MLQQHYSLADKLCLNYAASVCRPHEPYCWPPVCLTLNLEFIPTVTPETIQEGVPSESRYSKVNEKPIRNASKTVDIKDCKAEALR